MARALLIAEKPSLMRDIEKVYRKMNYPDQIDFACFKGHVMKALEPKEYKPEWGGAGHPWNWDMLPMIPDPFKMKVAPADYQQKIYKALKEKIDSGNYDYLINACDPDREAQAIFHYFTSHIKCQLPVKRFWLNSLTENEIKNMLLNLRDANEPKLLNLTDASVLRGQFDWLIGMNLTIAASLKMNATTKIGRVKTPTLRILVDRELAIRNFKPITTYELVASFGEYKGTYINKEGAVKFQNPKEATVIINQLNKDCFIESVESEIEKVQAPQLYNLSALQIEAGKMYGYGADETKDLVQQLYDQKFLTYPRTSNPYISTPLVDTFPKLLKSVMSVDELKNYAHEIIQDKERQQQIKRNKRYVNDKAMEESGHYAIIPTEVAPNFKELTKDQQNIYTLVSKRFIGMFMPPMKLSKTVLITNSNGHLFKTNGKTVIDEGHNVIFKKKSKDVMLPNLKERDPVTLTDTNTEERVTKPPARFTEPTLIEAMEQPAKYLDNEEYKGTIRAKKGIGTDATRGNIIAELYANECIEAKKGSGASKQLHATEKGIFIINNLRGKDIGSVDMTAIWEENLSLVEKGELKKEEFHQMMVKYLLQSIDDIKNSKMKQIEGAKSNTPQVIGKCPCCNNDLIMRKDYYICSQYKKTCNFVVKMKTNGADVSLEDIQNIANGKETRIMNFTSNKQKYKGKLYFDSSEKRVRINFVNEEVGKCPKCGGAVSERKDFYLCENYKKTCDFVIGKTTHGASVSKTEVQKILSGQETKILTFKFEKSESKGKLYYDTELKKVRIKFGVADKIIGTCPSCGSEIYEGKNYYLCKNYKKNCNVIFYKNYWGAEITHEDMKVMIDGGKTKLKTMKFTDGSVVESCLKIEDGKFKRCN